MRHKAFFNWSGGKDSALALYYALNQKQYHIERLLTNISREFRRVSMHGVREDLVEAQARSIGIAIQKLVVPDQPSMAAYETCLFQTMDGLKAEGMNHAFFGDIFLEDLRAYREAQLARLEIETHFPLWKRNTKELMHEFLDLGFKTILICTNANLLDESFAGRVIDKDFIKDLPPYVDPCGENGEFHTFVFDGPIFNQPVPFTIGEKVYREYKTPSGTQDENEKENASMGFWFCDLLPVNT